VDQILARADQNIARKFADRPLIEASIRHALGKAYEELGQYPKAEQHAARAVDLRLAHLGPEHAETIAAQNALGSVLLLQGKKVEARVLLDHLLTTARKVLGPEHEETLETVHSLAAALGSLGKHDEARALDEELLAIRKRVLGPDHAKTLSTMNSLANIWGAMGDLEKAKQLYEQVLTVGSRDQPNHPGTLVTMSSLARLYGRLNQNDRAIDLGRRSLEASVHVLGLSHPFTLGPIEGYAAAAHRSGRTNCEAAAKRLESLRDRSRRELGHDAATTIQLTNWLANTLVLLGEVENAVALIDELPENRRSLEARDDVAGWLYGQSHRTAALVQFQRVEALRSRLVPADDPFGQRIRMRLALALREAGRFDEARPVLEQVLLEGRRLGEKLPKPKPHVYPLGLEGEIAQFLLSRWPGLAPGISPAARPPASFAIEAPFRDRSPVADGRLGPEEYGPGIEVTFDDTNPGRLEGRESRSKTPDDLSVRIHLGYTDRSLFLAFRVRDQFVYASENNARAPHKNDGVYVHINGDQVANDMNPVFWPSGPAGAMNREGFVLYCDAAGHRGNGPDDATDAEWKAGTSRTSDGYIVEFEIRLALIDTRDGPGFVPAAGGSELRVNFSLGDRDTTAGDQADFGLFWEEEPGTSPWFGGEEFWTVNLRLAPRPCSRP
jgi:tetratricopeptide (TPR) repeat protein